MYCSLKRVELKPRFSRTLSYSKGVAVAQDLGFRGTAKEALRLLDSQNAVLNDERLAELTYGPKRPVIEKFEPHYLKMDSKVLCFDGYIRETVSDSPAETYRIRYLKLYYYLENDTLRVVEPETPNSMLFQGRLLKRGQYMHPCRTRNYTWKDLNIGKDLHLAGRDIHLYDCDTWTKQFLVDAGLEVGEPEQKPSDPYTEMRRATEGRREHRRLEESGLLHFFRNDGKVLRFFGIWKSGDSPQPFVRSIVLKYYLVDDSLSVNENYIPNAGWDSIRATTLTFRDVESGAGMFSAIIGRQKVALDRNKEIAKLPCYLDPSDMDTVAWIKPEHLKTGEDMQILGKTFFLCKSDEFTTHYYKEHFGIDIPQIEVMEKPKPAVFKAIVPPFDFGKNEETLQDCFHPYSKPPKRIPHQFSTKPAEFMNTILRFAAVLDTARETERIRKFVISFFMEDDTLKIHEEPVRNTGFDGGTFLARCRLKKGTPRGKEVFYEPQDLYVGAKLEASGHTFVITDADLLALKFMDNHPEIYTDINVEDEKKLINIAKGKKELTHDSKMRLLADLRNAAIMNYGCHIYPAEAIPDLGSNLPSKDNVLERLFCANLPISQPLLTELVDAFTFEGRTRADDVRAFLLVALGHTKEHPLP
ncbi:EF-hand domain-containing protein 1 [Caerostris darwini]|uniref:EF-hand domain-containing protein 1 n=1 Tax=Caerostris darwini TaxID=1538125 RepID=A0AAV4V062_9ARAC|nr:EF-hand domain-containing protein 1 [Caerostris darwini]